MMHDLQLTNTYCLLAHFLAPNKSPERRSALQTAITDEQIEWGPLVLQANIQMCTPLWYARLKQDDLLQHLPQDLQEYLQVLYESNRERNEELKAGLEELLAAFEKAGIDAILLKGAATFVDDLYGAPGARYMGDLDILVQPENIEICKSILKSLEYEEKHDPDKEFDNLPTDERHHHINEHIKPNSPLVVEIHFKVAYGKGGRALQTSSVWNNRQETSFRNYKTAILNPTDRILHNTLHALLPEREFLHGHVALLQLNEFAALTTRYAEEFNWPSWQQVASANGFNAEFKTYLTLAHSLSQTAWPVAIQKSWSSKFHSERIIQNGNRLSPLNNKEDNKTKRLTGKAYYYLRLPSWIWNNTCYAPGIKNLPARLKVLRKKLLTPHARAKI